MTKPTRTDRKARNAKAQAGVDKDLANISPVQFAGEQFTLSSLKAVFSDDSAAIDASDLAKTQAHAAVLNEQATRTRAALVYAALRSFIIGFFGAQAVTVLGDFGMNPPRSKATKTVSTMAVSVAKAKATRVARGTKGPVARQAVVGQVDAQAIKAAIDTPNTTPLAPTVPATPAAPAAPAPALPAPAPAKAGTTPQS